MKPKSIKRMWITMLFATGLFGAETVFADNMFGGWAEIGPPGNEPQSRRNRNQSRHSDGDGLGAVGYIYHIAKNEVSIQDWAAFYNADSGRTGSFNSDYDHWNTGRQSVGENSPAVNISFHQSAQYCNWLTSGSARKGAYAINDHGRVIGIDRAAALASYDPVYVVPTHDEWFKAAYYDGRRDTYFLYSHGSDSKMPHGSTVRNPTEAWNFRESAPVNYVFPSPNYAWPVGAGGEEVNGTVNMTGNVWEWVEDLEGAARGGSWRTTAGSFWSSQTNTKKDPAMENSDYGLRVVKLSGAETEARQPEPVIVPEAMQSGGRMNTVLQMAEPPGQVREPVVNPYAGVDWESYMQVQSVSHCHLWWDRPEDSRVRIQALYDDGVRHFPFSNYYPAAPMYPLQEYFKDLPEDILGGPNAEHHNATDHPLHFNSLGSFFRSSAPQGQSPRGLRIPWREAFDQALEKLQFEDGGGITINHPVWSKMKVEDAVTMFDHDPRVLGIEVYNWTSELLEGTGWALEFWDEMLSTGRNVLGFWVPDHPRRGPPPGRNVLLMPEFTEHAAMRAYRNGTFYGALRASARFTGISVDVPTIQVKTDQGETIRFLSQQGTVHEVNGTEGAYTLTGEEIYIRIEVDAPGGERLFSQPIIFVEGPEPSDRTARRR